MEAEHEVARECLLNLNGYSTIVERSNSNDVIKKEITKQKSAAACNTTHGDNNIAI